jgi:hypothetical protein
MGGIFPNLRKTKGSLKPDFKAIADFRRDNRRQFVTVRVEPHTRAMRCLCLSGSPVLYGREI